MKVTLHLWRERRERQLVEVEAFRTVRRLADQELREMASIAPASREVAAARAALAAATTAEEVVALEPLVRRAGFALGVDAPQGQSVRVADRWLSWADVGRSYAGVVAASRAAEAATAPAQRDTDVLMVKWGDQARRRT